MAPSSSETGRSVANAGHHLTIPLMDPGATWRDGYEALASLDLDANRDLSGEER